MSAIAFTLDKTLDELAITRNKLAVEAKIRPASILELYSGETKAIRIDTLHRILDTLNFISKVQNKRVITINDVINYIPDED